MNNTWSSRESYEADVTIVTVLFDGRNTGIPHSVGIYNEKWVDRLYRGIERNYSGTFDFICLVDRQYKFKENIRQVRFERSVDQYGWMSLMEMYRPNLCSGKRITMGLDTIITGPLNDIFSYNAKIALCTDPYFPNTICNAVTICDDQFCDEIWNLWINNENKIISNNMLEYGIKRAPSEMVLLRNVYGKSPRLDKLFKDRILSYKVHLKGHPERLKKSSIVYFHGDPKPNNLVNQLWVVENWK